MYVSDAFNLLMFILKMLCNKLDLVLKCHYFWRSQQETLQIVLLILSYYHWIFSFPFDFVFYALFLWLSLETFCFLSNVNIMILFSDVKLSTIFKSDLVCFLETYVFIIQHTNTNTFHSKSVLWYHVHIHFQLVYHCSYLC